MRTIALLRTLIVLPCAATAMGLHAPNARADGARLDDAVRHALTHAQGIDVSGIDVHVKGGIATLEGTVPTQMQIDKAEAVTLGVAGVRQVSNRLTLKEAGR